jgi:hypothetical protein
MKSFGKLVSDLRELLAKHPEIHFSLPKNPTEIDLMEAHFVLQGSTSSQVVVDDSIQDWQDRYSFFMMGMGRSFDV